MREVLAAVADQAAAQAWIDAAIAHARTESASWTAIGRHGRAD